MLAPQDETLFVQALARKSIVSTTIQWSSSVECGKGLQEQSFILSPPSRADLTVLVPQVVK